MKLAITMHAIMRWQELEDPALTYEVSRAEIVACLAERPERCGVTRRGQAVFRVKWPRHAYLVVKLRGHATNLESAMAGVIVTVLTPALWLREPDNVDEVAEVLAAWDELKTRQPPAGVQPIAAMPKSHSMPKGMTPPVPRTEEVLRKEVVGPQSMLHVAPNDHLGDWRSLAWTLAAIERERRIAEHWRYQVEDTCEKQVALGGLMRIASAVAIGTATPADLASYIDTAFPGMLEKARHRAERDKVPS